jgi:hypothetical protein
VAVEVAAQVAPIAHVRPEWFIREFNADETGGH